MAADRLERYTQAMYDGKAAVMALADAEQAELRAEAEEMISRGDAWADRALTAEAKVARVEALIGNWEATKGTPESEAWTRYVAERVRNALSGDYSSECEARA